MEYGSAEVEMQRLGFQGEGGAKACLLVDDLLATGGTMAAAVKLVQSCGAKVIECHVVVELDDLKGRDKVGAPVSTLIQL